MWTADYNNEAETRNSDFTCNRRQVIDIDRDGKDDGIRKAEKR